jgi:hypothetical protein
VTSNDGQNAALLFGYRYWEIVFANELWIQKEFPEESGIKKGK